MFILKFFYFLIILVVLKKPNKFINVISLVFIIKIIRHELLVLLGIKQIDNVFQFEEGCRF